MTWKSASRTAAIAGLSLSSVLVLGGNAAFTQTPSTIPEVIVDTEPVGDPSPSPAPSRTSTNTTTTTTTTTSSGDRRFACEYINGQYTVAYRPASQPDRAYPWAVPGNMGSGWTPERRCNEISARLESYRSDGLVELRTDVENNYNVVCVTSQQDPSCRIVFTVPPGQDPAATRDRVFENLALANEGRQTQGATTFSGGGSLNDLLNVGRNRAQDNNESINLRPFLDPADGGTGTQLDTTRQAAPTPQPGGGRVLDPGLFQ